MTEKLLGFNVKPFNRQTKPVPLKKRSIKELERLLEWWDDRRYDVLQEPYAPEMAVTMCDRKIDHIQTLLLKKRKRRIIVRFVFWTIVITIGAAIYGTLMGMWYDSDNPFINESPSWGIPD